MRNGIIKRRAVIDPSTGERWASIADVAGPMHAKQVSRALAKGLGWKGRPLRYADGIASKATPKTPAEAALFAELDDVCRRLTGRQSSPTKEAERYGVDVKAVKRLCYPAMSTSQRRSVAKLDRPLKMPAKAQEAVRLATDGGLSVVDVAHKTGVGEALIRSLVRERVGVEQWAAIQKGRRADRAKRLSEANAGGGRRSEMSDDVILAVLKFRTASGVPHVDCAECGWAAEQPVADRCPKCGSYSWDRYLQVPAVAV